MRSNQKKEIYCLKKQSGINKLFFIVSLPIIDKTLAILKEMFQLNLDVKNILFRLIITKKILHLFC